MVATRMVIDIIKIFPPIGIARLGNSPDEFFIGPEIPDISNPAPPPTPDGHYKDSSFRIKRQAARFRLFAYETGSSEPKEITLADVDSIKWTVQLANTKAEAQVFGDGINNQSDLDQPRNAKIEDRASLIIKPDSCTLTITPSNSDIERHVFTGTFLGKQVVLGEMRIEATGRLIVLGGFGFSDSAKDPETGMKIPLGRHSPGGDFADNDGWYDDVSDGPINASVRLKGTSEYIEASPAWVICAPPKFAPQIQHIITLYDTLLQVAVKKDTLRERLASPLLQTEPPSFTKDVYPLLLRTINTKWVLKAAEGMHRHIRQILYGSNGPMGSISQRQSVFYHLRNPDTERYTASVGQDMPKIWSDVYRVDSNGLTKPPYPSVNEALTPIQYHILDQWQKDILKKDGPNEPPVSETVITPDGLTRAALETCVGGPFYPGIETSFYIRDKYTFIEPFRLDPSNLSPGDLTKQMCVPWQSDFYECQTDNGKTSEGTLLDVYPIDQPDSTPPVPWTRNIISSDRINGLLDMVHNWHKLGFIVKQGDRYVETERNG
jgi:L-Lysine epsilon oxidase N-terminal/L-lysine epsilon oxidase C-terminal domain